MAGDFTQERPLVSSTGPDEMFGEPSEAGLGSVSAEFFPLDRKCAVDPARLAKSPSLPWYSMISMLTCP